MDNNLTPRQWALKRWLEDHFVSGRYWTIEEIVCNVKMPDGENAYSLNKDARNHDKCIALSNDVRSINWSISEGYKIIIKDQNGSVKLAESETEFNAWKQKEMDKVDKKYQYLNNLKWKASRDGTVPIVNQANNPVEPKDYSPVNVYAKEKVVKSGKYAGLTKAEMIVAAMVELGNDLLNKKD